MFFREKHIFISSWFFFTISIVFWRGKGGGKSCQFLIVLKMFFVLIFYMFFMARNLPFSSFHFFVFILIFLSFFLWRRSDGRWQNTSSREKSEANGGNGHQELIKESFLGVFFEHDRRSELMDQSQPRRLRPSAGYFRQRFSNSMFLLIDWLVCDTDSQWDTRWWRLVFRFSDEQRWTKRIKWSVSKIRSCARKTKKCAKATQWIGRRNKLTGR